MQVFLPYSSFCLCAQCLDNRRLLKQILECKQILNALNNGGPWSNHCITRTWRGYDKALVSYMNYCISEASSRGIGKFSSEIVNSLRLAYHSCPWASQFCVDRPPLPQDYFERYQLHLLHKDKEHYSKFFPFYENTPSGYYALNKAGTAWQLYSSQI